MVIKQKPFKRYKNNKFVAKKEKGKIKQGASSSCSTNAEKSNNKAPIVGGSKGANSNAPKASNPYAKPIATKCYSCNEIRHHSNECPKKSVNIVEREPEDEEEEFCAPDEDDVKEEYGQEEGVYVGEEGKKEEELRQLPVEVKSLLEEFHDVVPDELPTHE
ncbi:hypothetical protein GH714_005140 [Hevea brasiliensis]|uniref:CCHC-type domain-containing protein n=1 Tax=Hevea brasiliensis TaxID=3981 RepID=A0A6A6KMQ8_HEVBR|nr:hypothetical protein GH714_005140 [Hevea brasiliensis]